MPTPISNAPWRSENGLSKYPFSDEATMESISAVALPPGIFLDLSAVLPGASFPYLSRLYVGASHMSGSISDNSGEELASFERDMSEERADILSPAGSVCGVAIFSPHQSSWDLPMGELLFGQDATPLARCAWCGAPAGACVYSIDVGGQVLRGRVNIAAGEGVALTLSGDPGEMSALIDALGAQDGSEFSESDGGIKSINAVVPDENGVIRVSPSLVASPSSKADSRQLIQIRPGVAGITISLANNA